MGLAATVLLTLPFRWLDPPTSSIMLQRHYAARTSRATAGADVTPAWARSAPSFVWRDWEAISPHLAIAVVAAEDQKFPAHFGFDFGSIRNALEARTERRRGASTITQQVVKNLYLWPGRSLIRKAIEAYLTLAIEAFWPKRRILEVYLNLAELGPNVFGAEAASRLHFGKSAARLSPQEAALLAAGLPNPIQLSAGRPSPYVQERARTIRASVDRLGGARYLRDL